MDVGQRVNELRLNRKMTAKELASKVGVTPAFISALEHQSTNVSLKTLTKICQTFDMSLAEFFTFEPSSIEPNLILLLEQLSREQQTYLAEFIHSMIQVAQVE